MRVHGVEAGLRRAKEKGVLDRWGLESDGHLGTRYKRSAKPLARSSTMTCANQMMSSLFWYKDGGHIVRQ